MKRALLVNPPVYDFAAYDFWMKPYGLLKLARRFLSSGWKVYFFDFTDRFNPRFTDTGTARSDRWGRGHYEKKIVTKPAPVGYVPRFFKRYGIDERMFLKYLQHVDTPDVILISVTMTYWYPGADEVTGCLKYHFPGSDIIIGGSYVKLFGEHAHSRYNDERVYLDENFEVLEAITGIDFTDVDLEVAAWELYDTLRYGVVRTTVGCPFSCTYCASAKLHGAFRKIPVDVVAEELRLIYSKGGRDLAFYDDALMFNMEGLKEIMEILKKHRIGFNFHTPNAIHASTVTDDVAVFLRKNGFRTIFVGFEFGREEVLQKTGGKVRLQDTTRCVENLLRAGFNPNDIVFYVMFGHPDQEFCEAEEDVNAASKSGVRIMLSEFSPVKGTPDGDRAIEEYRIEDPIETNKTAFSIKKFGFEKVNALKNKVKELNKRLAA